MYEEQLVYIDSSYMMFYGSAAVLALVACIYLLFRRSNAIVPGITPPLRLRRWTAAFFAVMFLSHLWWWLIIHYALIGDLWLNFMVAASLDCLMVVPTLMAIMVVMLQDRRRPLWPIAAIQVPVVAFFAVCIPQRSNTIVPLIQYYFLFLGVGFIIYMVLALRQYRLWLCDNYADLEHKEIRYSIMALVVGLLFNVFYLSGSTGMVAQYAVQAFDYMFVILLLWRVETLQTLDDTLTQMPGLEAEAAVSTMVSPTTLPPDIDLLLEGRVEATQLYLRHDIRPSAPIAVTSACTSSGRIRLIMPTSTACVSSISSVSTSKPLLPSAPLLSSSWRRRVVSEITPLSEKPSSSRWGRLPLPGCAMLPSRNQEASDGGDWCVKFTKFQ